MKGFIPFFLLLSCSITISAQNLLSQSNEESLYRHGIELMAKKQFGAARENFSEFLTINTSDDLKRREAEYFLAFCALNLFHADAEKLFFDFQANYPEHPKTVTAHYDLANFYYLEKNYKKASDFYRKLDFTALSVEQNNIARFRLGYSLFSQKVLSESLEQFNYIKLQGGQYGMAASYYAGFVEYSQAEYDKALEDLKQAEENEGYSKIVPYLIANVYFKQKNYAQLFSYSSSLKSKDGVINQDEITLLCAEAHYNRNDYVNALAYYTQYLEGKEDRADKAVLLRAGYSAYITGKDLVATNFLKLSFTDNDSIGFYSAYYLGSLYLKTKQKPMAMTSFGIARMFKPDQKLVEEASFQYAKIAYELGQPDLAITEFEKILKTFPNSDNSNEIKELLSHAYVNAANYNKAIEYMESLSNRSATLDRAYQKATMLKGLDLFNKEDYLQAIVFFEKSLQNPSDKDYLAEASFWNGEAYSILKKYEQASIQYLRIYSVSGLTNKELVYKALYGLGYCYFNLQQYDKALFSFKQYVSKPDNNELNLSDGFIRLADCYYVSKAYNEALTGYRKAVTMNSADADYCHLQSGIILGILRRYSEATAELDRLIKNYPQSRMLDETIYQRAQLDFEQGNYVSAVAGYTKLINSYPASRFAPYAYTRRAASNYNLKEFNKTSDDYIKVLTSYPNHPAGKDVLLPLQESLTLAGRGAEFDKFLLAYKSANPEAKGIESVEFEAAKNLYFNQNYLAAIQQLKAYTIQYPESPRLAEANYYQAESQYRIKEFAKALLIYYPLSLDKTFSFSNKVINRIAELEFKAGNYDKAVPQYNQLIKVAANKKEQYAAWNGLMESYFLLAQYDSSKIYAEIILNSGNVNMGATNKASLFLGKIAKERGDFETAKDEFINTINAAQDENGAEAKYLLGELFYLNKDYKQCYETLVKLPVEFPTYLIWVGRSYLLLSDNYGAMDDTFNAKASLKSLIDNFPLESIRREANDKLKKLDMQRIIKAKKDTLDNDK